jgi:hypothetical protein
MRLEVDMLVSSQTTMTMDHDSGGEAVGLWSLQIRGSSTSWDAEGLNRWIRYPLLARMGRGSSRPALDQPWGGWNRGELLTNV